MFHVELNNFDYYVSSFKFIVILTRYLWQDANREKRVLYIAEQQNLLHNRGLGN